MGFSIITFSSIYFATGTALPNEFPRSLLLLLLLLLLLKVRVGWDGAKRGPGGGE